MREQEISLRILANVIGKTPHLSSLVRMILIKRVHELNGKTGIKHNKTANQATVS